ncbi:MAG: MFS transporter [Mycoplasmatales bacterium]|nr:MFS transporter [Mycoplasmatales bacterium]
MKKIIEIFTHGLSKKILIAIFVLAAVDMFSMAAPYYLKYVIPDVYTYLKISQGDFDQLNAILGYVVLATQLPSGWLADKISGKKLLIISVVLSGIFTVMFGLATMGIFGSLQLIILYLVFIGFGVSTTLFLWSPLWKVLSEQSGSKDQGKLYGLQGSYNGLLGLIFITLIGTIATSMSKNGNNQLFYALVFIIAAALFISAWGIHKFVKDTNQKSSLLILIKSKFNKEKKKNNSSQFKNNLKTIFSLRAILLSFFVLGMYMFQSIFAYYLKSYLSIISTGTIVAAVAGLRTYGLRFIISGPWGKWLEKRKSWIFTLIMVLIVGILVATGFVLSAGFGNNITAKTSSGYILTLQILFPILFILVGVASWLLVAGRYMQISEIPNTKNTLGSIIALISFIAFSSDAWFYQMASSWMKSAGHEMTANDVIRLGYGSKGGYDQAGLQLLLFTALGISLFGALCGSLAFIINNIEKRKLNKSSYRWRTEGEN